MERQHCTGQTKKKAAEEEQRTEAAGRLEMHESAPCREAGGDRSPAYRFKLPDRHDNQMTHNPNFRNGSKADLSTQCPEWVESGRSVYNRAVWR